MMPLKEDAVSTMTEFWNIMKVWKRKGTEKDKKRGCDTKFAL